MTNALMSHFTLFLKHKCGNEFAPGTISCAMCGILENVFSTINANMLTETLIVAINDTIPLTLCCI